MKRTLLISQLIFSGLTGCSAGYQAIPYNISVDNTLQLNYIAEKTLTKIREVTISSNSIDTSPITCRAAGKIRTATGQNYGDYIKDAIIREFSSSGLYNKNGKYKLELSISKLDFSSKVPASWETSIAFNFDNGKRINLNYTYPFETFFIGEEACRAVAMSFYPFVVGLISELSKKPEFLSILQNP